MNDPKILTTFSFDNATTLAKSMTIDDNGNYIIVGKITPDNSSEHASSFAVKIDSSGNIIWKNTYPNEYGSSFNSIVKLSDGSLVVLGTYNYSPISSDQYTSLTKLDNDGNFVKGVLLGLEGVQSNGECIAATSDAGFAIALSYVDDDLASTTVTKFNSNISLEWSKTFNIDVANSIIQTSDGGYALSGNTAWDESLNSSPFIAKLNIYGDFIWRKVYDDIKIYGPITTSIIETKSNQFAVVAKSVILLTDSLGNMLSSTKNPSYNLDTLVEVDDTTICVAGYELSDSMDLAFGGQVTIPNLEFISTKSGNNPPSGITHSLLDKNNSFAVCGFMINDSFLAIF